MRSNPSRGVHAQRRLLRRSGIVLAALLLVLSPAAAQQPGGDARQGALFEELARLDRELFDAAFVRCDADDVIAFFSEDVEFYHDETGLARGEEVREDFRELTRNCPGENGIRRVVVDGSLAVYPIHDFGAVQQGSHRFIPSDGTLGSIARFVHLWRRDEDRWRVTRVLSFDHRPYEPDEMTLISYGPLGAPGLDSRLMVGSSGWELVGDLRLPAPGDTRPPVALLLHQAAGDRSGYADLAERLAERGVASLRIDLRGHGESVNRGSFEPGPAADSELIERADADIDAIVRHLRSHPAVDGRRIAVVGASYSGEEMAQAGRASGWARAYVALSPGSLSAESIAGIDRSGVPWLFVAAREDRHLREITASVLSGSESAELLLLPGGRHALGLLEEHPGLTSRLATWLAEHLRGS